MKIKEGIGWKAAYNEEKGVGGGEVTFRGSWELYEISAATFGRLSEKMRPGDAEKLIESGRCLYRHVNDECGPEYNVVLDEDYAVYCPWMEAAEPVGKTWDADLTDAAVELFESEKDNRDKRRKKREKRETK